jgi:hypothetical protein
MSNQVGGDAVRVGAKMINKRGVPEMVQVACAEPSRRNPFVIATAIMVIRGMQRLMEVTDKVEQELEGDNLFLRVSGRLANSAANS